MASRVAKAENITNSRLNILLPSIGSSVDPQNVQIGLKRSSSYAMSARSQYSHALDEWIRGPSPNGPASQRPTSARPTSPRPTSPRSTSPAYLGVSPCQMQNIGVQRSSMPSAPQPNPFNISNLWYFMALAFSVLNKDNWRCTQSTIMARAEVIVNHIILICQRIRGQFQRLADEQATDLFAAGMDILLIVYALGFLVLSLYQASAL